jgi:hypothetical protein
MMARDSIVNDNEKALREPRFDFAAPAELYMLRARGARGRAAGYRRFASAAEAIRFAVEEVPEQQLIGVVMEVEEGRFDHKALRALYARKDYPLSRP